MAGRTKPCGVDPEQPDFGGNGLSVPEWKVVEGIENKLNV
jgi:hypothetical protein